MLSLESSREQSNSPIETPPLLTDREFDILTHMVGGKSRLEMADALEISPETVKLHVRRLLKKFGATRSSNCMSQLTDYYEHYSADSGGKGVFIKSIRCICDIRDNFSRFIFRGTSEIVCIRPKVRNMTRAFNCIGDRISLKLNGKDVPESWKGAKGYELKITFPRDLSPGDVFVSEFEFEYENCGSDQKLDTLISHPTGELNVLVRFDNSSKPSKVWAGYETPLARMSIVKEGFSFLDQTAALHVRSPITKKVYGIRWHK